MFTLCTYNMYSIDALTQKTVLNKGWWGHINIFSQRGYIVLTRCVSMHSYADFFFFFSVSFFVNVILIASKIINLYARCNHMAKYHIAWAYVIRFTFHKEEEICSDFNCNFIFAQSTYITFFEFNALKIVYKAPYALVNYHSR